MKTLVIIILIGLNCIVGASECDSVPNSKILFRPGVVVMLGELHGTEQAPAALSSIVCNALGNGLDVIVGLELPIAEQERLDQFMSSNGTAKDRANLISGHFWQKDYQDGRSSLAMQNLIDSLRSYGAADSNSVRVVFIDNPGAMGGQDKFMAERLSATISKSPNSFVIALTGNVHNRVVLGSHFDDKFEAMGYRFTYSNPETEIYSLNMAYEDGTAWICAVGSECGVMRLRGNGEDEGQGVAVYQRNELDAYDDVYYVGKITASMPAKDQ